MGLELRDLPKGWTKCFLQDIAEIKYGKDISIKKISATGNYPVYGANGIIGYLNDYLFEDEQVLISCRGAYSGKINMSPPKCYVTHNSLVLDFNKELKRNKKYFYYAFQNLDKSKFVTGSAQPQVTITNANLIEVNLAPLNEQKRIVAKLDKLLSKVETAKARLDTIPQTLKRFRQSVLSAAVSGELTKDWRAKNNINQEWKDVVLSEVSTSRLGKMLDKAKNQGEKTKYLRNINVRWFLFDLNDLAELRITSIEKETLDIKNGDLLVCEGGEPGRCAVWENGKTNFTFQKAIHRVRLNENVVPKWLAFNLKKDADSQRLEDYFTGTTIKHLTGQSLKTYSFSLPPLKEQKEIVRRVEQLFKFADQIEARYNKAKQYTDKLTQSILAKAFRGELVPQDPKDEPAEKLLERIRTMKKMGENI